MSDRKEPTISGLRPESSEPTRPASAASAKSNSDGLVRRRVVKKVVKERPAQSSEAAQTQESVAEPTPMLEHHYEHPMFHPDDQLNSQATTQIIKKGVSPIFYILLIALLAGLGYTQWQLMGAVEQLKSSDQRISDLEGQLTMSGEETEVSSAAIQAKLKWADSEIRKLWGISYDRNKKAIAENKTNITSLTGKVKKLNSGLELEVKKQIGAANVDMAKQVKAVTGEVVLLNDLVAANEASLSGTEKTAKNVSADMKKLRAEMDKMQSRVADNEQSIESINAFRRSVNKQLLAQ